MLMGPDTPYRFVHEIADAHLAVSVPRRMIELGDESFVGPGVGIDPEPVTDLAGSLIDYCRSSAASSGAAAPPSSRLRFAGASDPLPA